VDCWPDGQTIKTSLVKVIDQIMAWMHLKFENDN